MKIKNGILTSVFDSDISLSGIFFVPSEVRVIGFKAFFLNASVREVVLHDRVREIDKFAFGGCVNLEKIEIHKGVKNIGEYAFCGCVSLNSIYLPTSIKKIGQCAFLGCSNKLKVYVDNHTEFYPNTFPSYADIVYHDEMVSQGSLVKSRIIVNNSSKRGSSRNSISITNGLQEVAVAISSENSYLSTNSKPQPPKSQLESNAGLFLGLSPAKTLWDKLVKLFARRDDGSLPLPNRRKWTTDQYYQQVNLWLDNHITTKRK